MGDSLPPPASIDLVGSYARTTGGTAEIILWDPKLQTTSGTIVLRRKRRAVTGPIELVEDAEGTRLVGRIPRRELGNGIWGITVRAADGTDEPVAARLLVQAERPLVLLWGAKATPTRLPAGKARTTPRSALVETGGRVLDGALGVLPADRAVQVRAGIRRAARKVLR